MVNLLSQLFNLFGNDRRAPTYPPDPLVLPTLETPPAQSDALAPVSVAALHTLNWSHPFKDKRDPLLQLTQMAEAVAGYYPLGCSGLWHYGVHFDSGTAGTLDQSSVHCLADGEVVAYRIDEHSPTTIYATALIEKKPYSRNFVLVRHRLEAPKIEGSPDVPPRLTFYSLYMHLQDWADYQQDPAIARPAFWPEGQVRRVKATVKDVLPSHPGQQGLNVRNQAQRGKVLALLPRGAQVTVSGEGDYRKLENTTGPDFLKNADGSLRGYLSLEHLVPIAGDEYRVNAKPTLRVREEANVSSEIITELPHGTEVLVSGEGAFRKLERVNQYVHFDSLESAREPMADRIVVLDQPIAIKAGDLIGHIGKYQGYDDALPEKKLHLEVFSCDEVDLYLEASRAWAQRLPATGKTWLKLAKGTQVVAHQARFNATQPPSLSAANTPSHADLLVPKSLLDGLSAEKKITTPATPDRKACNWYLLEGLLYDANNKRLDGWVCEEVGVTPTPWVNPWSWEGYEVIYNYDTPRQALASFRRVAGHFSKDEVERYGALADKSDKGVMKGRLRDIINRDCNSRMTADEVKAAIKIPAYAQSLSQLIIHDESEWYYTPRKWDSLDEVLGHCGSTPELNWVAEKERIKQISWWSEVAPRIGLSERGRVYHFHPVGLVANFSLVNHENDLDKLIRLVGDIISHGEGSYESYNTGTKDVPGGRVGYSFLHPLKGTITGKTIDEIIATDSLSGLDRNRIFASGKYQIIISTLKSAKQTMGLTGNETYDEIMQERIFSEYLFKKAGGGALARFVREGKGSFEDAQYAASKEWASIATPAGRKISDGRISDGTISYYSGSANSANAESTAGLRAILDKI